MKTDEDYRKEFSNARNQIDYKGLLEDPNTPEKIIKFIVDSLTDVDLQILALKHPSISAISQRHILKHAVNTPNQYKIVESFLSIKTDIIADNWIKIRQWYNKDLGFDMCVLKLLKKQSDVFTTQKLDVIFNSLPVNKDNIFGYMTGVLNHYNFNVSILDGYFIENMYSTIAILLKKDPSQSRFYQIFSESKFKNDIFLKLYNLTKDIWWLPQEAQDIFSF